MAEYIKTVDPNGGADYLSLALWEAAEQNLYEAGDVAIALCRRTGPEVETYTTTTGVHVAGWTAGVIPQIKVDPAFRHQGNTNDQRDDGNYVHKVMHITNASYPICIRMTGQSVLAEGLFIDVSAGPDILLYYGAIGTYQTTGQPVIDGCYAHFSNVDRLNTLHYGLAIGSSPNEQVPGIIMNSIVDGPTGSFHISGVCNFGTWGTLDPPVTTGYLYNNITHNLYRGCHSSNSSYSILKNNIVIPAAHFNNTNSQATGGASWQNIYALCESNMTSHGQFCGTTDAKMLNVDPDDLFIDPANGDFRLKANSPALRRGVTVPEVTTDITGRTRYSAGVQDIGAFSTTDGATFIVNTDNNEGRANWYTSLALAEAALPATLTEPYVIECSGATADTTNVLIAGSSSTATNFLTIVGNSKIGVYDQTKYRLNVVTGIFHCVESAMNYLNIRNLQISGQSSQTAIQVGGVDAIVDGVFVFQHKGGNRASLRQYGNNAAKLINNVVLVESTSASQSGLAAYNINSVIANNVVIGATRYGVDNGDWYVTSQGGNTAAQVYNNICLNCSVADFIMRSGVHSNNLSSDESALGEGSLINQAAADIFTDPDNGDFTLKANSPALRRGVTVPEVTTDITGRTRYSAGVQDIGAFSTTEGATYVVNTDNNEGRANWYTSLSLAEAALPATLTEPYVIECSGVAADNVTVDFSSENMETTHLTLKSTDTFEDSFINLGYRFTAVDNFTAFRNTILSYLHIENFFVSYPGFGYNPMSLFHNCTVEKLTVYLSATTGQPNGLTLATSFIGSIRNSLFYSVNAHANTVYRNFVNSSSESALLENCTAYVVPQNEMNVIRRASGVLTVKNCVSISFSASSTKSFNGTFGALSSNNISSDATAPGTNSLINQVAADLFTDHANGDFRLKAGSPALRRGVTVAGVTTDIAGRARYAAGVQDIGAFSTTDGATFIVNTDNNEGRANWYTSLSLAEAALPTVLEEPYVIECSGVAADTAATAVNGITTTEVNSLTIAGEGIEGGYNINIGNTTYLPTINTNISNVTVKRIKIHSRWSYGISVSSGSNILVEGNYITATTGAGIYKGGTGGNVRFNNNLIVDVDTNGILFNGSGSASNNTIIGTGDRGIVRSDGTLVLINNIVVNTINAAFSGWMGFDPSNNISSDATAPGTNSLTNQLATDIFTDPANGDFTLKVGSPALRRGVTVPEVTTDITGRTRYSAGVQDIGAFSTTEGATFIVNTDNNEGRANWYTSLSLAEAALPTTLTEPYVIECSGATADTSSSSITVTTSVDNDLIIRGANRLASGLPEYRLVYNDKRAIYTESNHVTVDNVAFYSQSAFNLPALEWKFSSNIKIKNCFAKIQVSNLANEIKPCFQQNAVDVGAIIENCVFHATNIGTNQDPIRAVAVINKPGSNGLTLRNCVASGFRSGLATGRSQPAYVNCIAVNASTACFDTTAINSSNNISSDATAPGTNSLINQAAADIFTDPANGDFRLKVGSNAIGAGLDLSAHFTTDITGAERTTPWDIGAFMYVASVGGTPFLLYYDSNNKLNYINLSQFDTSTKTSTILSKESDSLLKSSTEETKELDTQLSASYLETFILNFDSKVSIYSDFIKSVDSRTASSTEKTFEFDTIDKVSNTELYLADTITRIHIQHQSSLDSSASLSNLQHLHIDSKAASSTEKTFEFSTIDKVSNTELYLADTRLHTAIFEAILYDAVSKLSKQESTQADSTLLVSNLSNLIYDTRVYVPPPFFPFKGAYIEFEGLTASMSFEGKQYTVSFSKEADTVYEFSGLKSDLAFSADKIDCEFSGSLVDFVFSLQTTTK